MVNIATFLVANTIFSSPKEKIREQKIILQGDLDNKNGIISKYNEKKYIYIAVNVDKYCGADLN